MDVVLLLVAMMVVVVAWGWGKDKLAARAHQVTVARQNQKRGQELVGTALRGTATATPLAVRDALASLVETVDAPPVLVPDIYVESEHTDRILYACGNRIATTFRAILILRAADGRVVVEQRFLEWTTADGVVSPVATMQRLRTDIARAIRAVDPQATVTVVPRKHHDTPDEAP